MTSPIEQYRHATTETRIVYDNSTCNAINARYILNSIKETSSLLVKNGKDKTMCNFSAFVAFNKATNRQTDIKHDTDEAVSGMSLSVGPR